MDSMDDLRPVIPPLHIAGRDPRVQLFGRSYWGVGTILLDHRFSIAPDFCISTCGVDSQLDQDQICASVMPALPIVSGNLATIGFGATHHSCKIFVCRQMLMFGEAGHWLPLGTGASTLARRRPEKKDRNLLRYREIFTEWAYAAVPRSAARGVTY